MDQNTNPLWTRDFTIITLGSVVSMFGNAMSGFAISLLVLDYTGSTLLYALYIAAFTIPHLVMPVLSGAVLDRFSRKKTIYTLDFISAGLYAATAGIFLLDIFSFPLLIVFCLVIGSVESIYMVAYESFYPLLITEGNYSRAYSISSVLETLSAVMVPVSAFAYNLIGIAPLLSINAVCFLVAAIMETRIRTEEVYIETQKATEIAGAGRKRQLSADIREGLRYLRSEKGLSAVAFYFAFSSLAGGASSTITLPYFKATFHNGEYIYMLVWGMAIAGRAVGGMIHYRVRLPVQKKYSIALTVYVSLALLEGVYLFTPIPVMMLICLATGLLGVTSYTIRISATQSYVPDEKKGRFNGAFNVINTAGALLGELSAGVFTLFLPQRIVLLVIMLISGAAALLIIGGNRQPVSAIYNRQQ